MPTGPKVRHREGEPQEGREPQEGLGGPTERDLLKLALGASDLVGEVSLVCATQLLTSQEKQKMKLQPFSLSM